MKFDRLTSTAIQLYPIVYGLILLLLVNRVFSPILYSVYCIPCSLSISVLTKVAISLVNNIVYTLILLFLIFIEVVRILIIKSKAVLLLEALLLLLYTWSIEIMILYIILGSIYIKLVERYMLKHTITNDIPINAKANNIAITRLISITRFSRVGLMFIMMGVCLGIHILYSYAVHINLITILIYLMSCTTVYTIKIREKYIAINKTLKIVLASIPPFGILLLFKNQP